MDDDTLDVETTRAGMGRSLLIAAFPAPCLARSSSSINIVVSVVLLPRFLDSKVPSAVKTLVITF